MRIIFKVIRLLSLSAISWLVSNPIVSQQSFAQEKLVIAIQPTLSSDEMLNKAKPLEKFIRDSLGGKTEVQIYVPSSYAAVVESLRFGHAHVGFMSAWPAQLAVRLGGAEVPLAEVRQVIIGKEKKEAKGQVCLFPQPDLYFRICCADGQARGVESHSNSPRQGSRS